MYISFLSFILTLAFGLVVIIRMGRKRKLLNTTENMKTEHPVWHFKRLALLRRLVAGFPPMWPGFRPRSGHVGFVEDKTVLG
jgi:hypothetical protein